MNLRWNKVVICTDADVDGYQIRTLILTMLWRLPPSLESLPRTKARPHPRTLGEESIQEETTHE